MIAHLPVGTAEEGRIVVSCAPRLQLAETEVDIRTVAVTRPRSRPDSDRTKCRQREAWRKPKYDGRLASDRLLERTTADLLVLCNVNFNNNNNNNNRLYYNCRQTATTHVDSLNPKNQLRHASLRITKHNMRV